MNNDHTQQLWLVGVGSFIVGVVLGLLVSTMMADSTMPHTEDRETLSDSNSTSTVETDPNAVTEEQQDRSVRVDTDTDNTGLSGSWHVQANNQKAGTSVVVESATLRDIGWIAVRENINGEMGNVLGAVRKNAGTHTSIAIDLLRKTVPNQAYYVVIYKDNGDGEFQYTQDTLVEVNQQTVYSTFRTISG